MDYQIILGLGNDSLNDITRGQVEEHGIGKVVSVIHTRKNILSRVVETGADMVFVSDMLVGDSEQDWLEIFDELLRIDIRIRIVFLCKRPDDDLFLTKIAMMRVTDIFNEGGLPAGWSNQLKLAPNYELTERFRKSRNDEAIKELKGRKRPPRPSPDEILLQAENGTIIQPERTETVKIVEKIVIEKEIVVEQVKIPSRSVAIVSLFEGVGSSLLTRIFAEYLASFKLNVAVVESATASPCWFEMIDAHEMASKKTEWKSWHRMIQENEEIPRLDDLFLVNGVRYAVRANDDKMQEWEESDTAYLLAYSRDVSVLLYDLSGQFDCEQEQIVLRSAQSIIVVGGYDVIRVERSHAKYQKYLEKFKDKTVFVLNKSTKRLIRNHAAAMKNIYNTKKLFHVPAMNEIHDIYVDGESFWTSKWIKEEQKLAMREVMEPLSAEILGKDVLRLLRLRKMGSITDRIQAFFSKDDGVEVDESTA